MSKELPYFQFEPAEHLAGDIQMCSLAAQGLFANIKSIYWIKGCELSIRQLRSRFSQNELVDELIQEQALKVKNDNVSISFLDAQYELLLKRKKRLSDAGKKGYLRKVEKALLKPPLSNADEATLKQPEEKRREEKIYNIVRVESNDSTQPPKLTFEDKYREFIKHFNYLKGRETGSVGQFKGEDKSKRQFKVIRGKYTNDEIVRAVKSMFNDKHHIENGFRYATPELLTRPEKFEMFLQGA